MVSGGIIRLSLTPPAVYSRRARGPLLKLASFPGSTAGEPGNEGILNQQVVHVSLIPRPFRNQKLEAGMAWEEG